MSDEISNKMTDQMSDEMSVGLSDKTPDKICDKMFDETSVATFSDTTSEAETDWIADMTPRYMTSEMAASTSSEQGLLPETKLLIECSAKFITSNMLTQLGQATDISHQYTSNPDYMNGKQPVDVLHQVIHDAFRGNLTHRFGIKRTIIIDISGFIDPENPLFKALSRTNWSLVPSRLIQKIDRPISREASRLFALEFCNLLKDTFIEGIKAKGLVDVRIREIFRHEQIMHRAAHGKAEGSPCCILKMLEEDYDMAFDKGKLDNNNYTVEPRLKPSPVFKHQIVDFGIKCEICSGEHEFKVVR
ncbi:uncharacterized protein N0V89_005121 [Didymosphaeria variabile]|uniref:Uncharacterized protein n=1 Tax=Didymosphaeria variabile TaxID=1932322 RepID=A0A9W9CAX2_9PLEO|nr:uncharacterized protein N0V89_005121 [Didymosphaeria variabile]KAJ4353392.1 hypothetical protein N0V89_005121 [Didymosphaeria variabile]